MQKKINCLDNKWSKNYFMLYFVYRSNVEAVLQKLATDHLNISKPEKLTNYEWQLRIPIVFWNILLNIQDCK